MDMIADRVIATRERDAGRTPTPTAVRCAARSGFASLGGATLDNEENYLHQEAVHGARRGVQIENQARI